jgi:glutamate-1-semialdehyde 2,1-aminomutase
MQWMVEWSGGFPVMVESGSGAHLIDIDGNEYVDYCLGDTGSLFGHGVEQTTAAVCEQAKRGFNFMLPNEDTVWVAEELARRFGLPFWQFAITATDANRFLLRLARDVTGRPKILVFNGCYHGTVDETIVALEGETVLSRHGNVGPAFDPANAARVCEFNDLDALERNLREGDVACVLTEPALTNVGIVLPDPEFHEGLRRLTRKHSTLLIIDETQTITTSPNGYTGAFKLEPDAITLGKPIANGIAAAAYGLSEDFGNLVRKRTTTRGVATAGIGGTLSANCMALHVMRATLEHLMTSENYAHMCKEAKHLEAGIWEVVNARSLDWHITQLGAKVSYRFNPERPRNGTEGKQGTDSVLEQCFHLFFLNRGIMMSPMHKPPIMQISPSTTEKDVESHLVVLRSFVEECIENE